MLHGHIHSDGLYNLSNLETGIKRYDVGVDANGYYPVSINQIENFFKSIMKEEEHYDIYYRGLPLQF